MAQAVASRRVLYAREGAPRLHLGPDAGSADISEEAKRSARWTFEPRRPDPQRGERPILNPAPLRESGLELLVLRESEHGGTYRLWLENKVGEEEEEQDEWLLLYEFELFVVARWDVVLAQEGDAVDLDPSLELPARWVRKRLPGSGASERDAIKIMRTDFARQLDLAVERPEARAALRERRAEEGDDWPRSLDDLAPHLNEAERMALASLLLSADEYSVVAASKWTLHLESVSAEEDAGVYVVQSDTGGAATSAELRDPSFALRVDAVVELVVLPRQEEDAALRVLSDGESGAVHVETEDGLCSLVELEQRSGRTALRVAPPEDAPSGSRVEWYAMPLPPARSEGLGLTVGDSRSALELKGDRMREGLEALRRESLSWASRLRWRPLGARLALESASPFLLLSAPDLALGSKEAVCLVAMLERDAASDQPSPWVREPSRADLGLPSVLRRRLPGGAGRWIRESRRAPAALPRWTSTLDWSNGDALSSTVRLACDLAGGSEARETPSVRPRGWSSTPLYRWREFASRRLLHVCLVYAADSTSSSPPSSPLPRAIAQEAWALEAVRDLLAEKPTCDPADEDWSFLAYEAEQRLRAWSWMRDQGGGSARELARLSARQLASLHGLVPLRDGSGDAAWFSPAPDGAGWRALVISPSRGSEKVRLYREDASGLTEDSALAWLLACQAAGPSLSDAARSMAVQDGGSAAAAALAAHRFDSQGETAERDRLLGLAGYIEADLLADGGAARYAGLGDPLEAPLGALAARWSEEEEDGFRRHLGEVVAQRALRLAHLVASLELRREDETAHLQGVAYWEARLGRDALQPFVDAGASEVDAAFLRDLLVLPEYSDEHSVSLENASTSDAAALVDAGLLALAAPELVPAGPAASAPGEPAPQQEQPPLEEEQEKKRRRSARGRFANQIRQEWRDGARGGAAPRSSLRAIAQARRDASYGQPESKLPRDASAWHDYVRGALAPHDAQALRLRRPAGAPSSARASPEFEQLLEALDRLRLAEDAMREAAKQELGERAASSLPYSSATMSDAFERSVADPYLHAYREALLALDAIEEDDVAMWNARVLAPLREADERLRQGEVAPLLEEVLAKERLARETERKIREELGPLLRELRAERDPQAEAERQAALNAVDAALDASESGARVAAERFRAAESKTSSQIAGLALLASKGSADEKQAVDRASTVLARARAEVASLEARLEKARAERERKVRGSLLAAAAPAWQPPDAAASPEAWPAEMDRALGEFRAELAARLSEARRTPDWMESAVGRVRQALVAMEAEVVAAEEAVSHGEKERALQDLRRAEREEQAARRRAESARKLEEAARLSAEAAAVRERAKESAAARLRASEAESRARKADEAARKAKAETPPPAQPPPSPTSESDAAKAVLEAAAAAGKAKQQQQKKKKPAPSASPPVDAAGALRQRARDLVSAWTAVASTFLKRDAHEQLVTNQNQFHASLRAGNDVYEETGKAADAIRAAVHDEKNLDMALEANEDVTGLADLVEALLARALAAHVRMARVLSAENALPPRAGYAPGAVDAAWQAYADALRLGGFEELLRRADAAVGQDWDRWRQDFASEATRRRTLERAQVFYDMTRTYSLDEGAPETSGQILSDKINEEVLRRFRERSEDYAPLPGERVYADSTNAARRLRLAYFAAAAKAVREHLPQGSVRTRSFAAAAAKRPEEAADPPRASLRDDFRGTAYAMQALFGRGFDLASLPADPRPEELLRASRLLSADEARPAIVARALRAAAARDASGPWASRPATKRLALGAACARAYDFLASRPSASGRPPEPAAVAACALAACDARAQRLVWFARSWLAPAAPGKYPTLAQLDASFRAAWAPRSAASALLVLMIEHVAPADLSRLPDAELRALFLSELGVVQASAALSRAFADEVLAPLVASLDAVSPRQSASAKRKRSADSVLSDADDARLMAQALHGSFSDLGMDADPPVLLDSGSLPPRAAYASLLAPAAHALRVLAICRELVAPEKKPIRKGQEEEDAAAAEAERAGRDRHAASLHRDCMAFLYEHVVVEPSRAMFLASFPHERAGDVGPLAFDRFDARCAADYLTLTSPSPEAARGVGRWTALASDDDSEDASSSSMRILERLVLDPPDARSRALSREAYEAVCAENSPAGPFLDDVLGSTSRRSALLVQHDASFAFEDNAADRGWHGARSASDGDHRTDEWAARSAWEWVSADGASLARVTVVDGQPGADAAVDALRPQRGAVWRAEQPDIAALGTREQDAHVPLRQWLCLHERRGMLEGAAAWTLVLEADPVLEWALQSARSSVREDKRLALAYRDARVGPSASQAFDEARKRALAELQRELEIRKNGINLAIHDWGVELKNRVKALPLVPGAVARPDAADETTMRALINQLSRSWAVGYPKQRASSAISRLSDLNTASGAYADAEAMDRDARETRAQLGDAADRVSRELSEYRKVWDATLGAIDRGMAPAVARAEHRAPRQGTTLPRVPKEYFAEDPEAVASRQAGLFEEDWENLCLMLPARQ
jgi:hypothetical protein